MNRLPSCEQVARETEALRLKTAGETYAEIAEKLDFHDASGARKAVLRLMRNQQVDEIDTSRALELSRLEVLHQALWPRALEGDSKAINSVLKVATLRIDLLNLRSQTSPQVSATSTHEKSAKERLAEILADWQQRYDDDVKAGRYPAPSVRSSLEAKDF